MKKMITSIDELYASSEAFRSAFDCAIRAHDTDFYDSSDYFRSLLYYQTMCETILRVYCWDLKMILDADFRFIDDTISKTFDDLKNKSAFKD